MRSFYFYLLMMVGLISSCHLETAHPSKTQKLFIASDYLDAKDESLFKEFEESSGVKVFILHSTTDSIQKQLLKEKYATDIDLVMLSSVFDACHFSKEKLLQPILNTDDQPDISFRLRATDYQWVGIAIDPYIFVQMQDSNRRSSNYLEFLQREAWTTNLREASLLPFFMGLQHRIRGESDSLKNQLFSKIFEREQVFRRPGDSANYFNSLLTTYSSFYSDSTLYKSAYRKGKIVFPNQSFGGLHFNLRTVAIVKQAKNYSNAIEFIRFVTEEKANERINNWWNTFPVNSNMNKMFSYQRKYFRRYSAEFPVLFKSLDSVKSETEKWRKNKANP